MNKEPLLIPVDLSIEDEKEKKEIENLCNDTSYIKSIMADLNSMLYYQNEPLQEIENLTTESVKTVEEANKHVEKARVYQKKAMILKATILGGGIGFIIGGPLGAYAGYQIGLTLIGGVFGGVALAGLGGGTSYSILKNKNK